MILEPGATFGRYELRSVLGRGGMGVVFLARDTRLDRPVALKVISENYAENADFRARFARETTIAAKLRHPNIVTVYDAEELEGRMYISMVYIDGEDLGRILQWRHRLGADELMPLALMLGSALDHAHEMGLVHRDVKPSNVLLSHAAPDHHLYLSDFGLARETVSDQALTHTGQWVGTADYISPEQFSDGVVSARSDIYSMTCVLFHALTGTVPYPGPDPRKWVGHTSEPLPLIGAVHPHADAIEKVLRRGSQKTPDDRYASAGDLARAFARAVAGQDISVNEREVATGAARSGIPTQPDAGLSGQRSQRTVDGRQREERPTPVMSQAQGHGRRGRREASIAAAAWRRAGAVALVVLLALGVAIFVLARGGGQRPPVPTASGPEPFTLAAIGAGDDSVWVVYEGAPHWSATGQFVATGDPSMATGGGRTVIAARGAANGTIWYAVAGVPRWVSTAPANVFTGASDPTVSLGSTGQITIADRGSDNTVWWVQPGQHGWASTGHFEAVGNPSIATAAGKTVVAARDTADDSIWYTVLGSGTWNATAPASVFRGASDPTVSLGSTGQITIADRGSDNTVWWVQPGRHRWHSLGTFHAAGDPAVAISGSFGGR